MRRSGARRISPACTSPPVDDERAARCTSPALRRTSMSHVAPRQVRLAPRAARLAPWRGARCTWRGATRTQTGASRTSRGAHRTSPSARRTEGVHLAGATRRQGLHLAGASRTEGVHLAGASRGHPSGEVHPLGATRPGDVHLVRATRVLCHYLAPPESVPLPRPPLPIGIPQKKCKMHYPMFRAAFACWGDKESFRMRSGTQTTLRLFSPRKSTFFENALLKTREPAVPP